MAGCFHDECFGAEGPSCDKYFIILPSILYFVDALDYCDAARGENRLCKICKGVWRDGLRVAAIETVYGSWMEVFVVVGIK